MAEDYEGAKFYGSLPEWLTVDIFLDSIIEHESNFAKVLKFKVIEFALDWLRVRIKIELKNGTSTTFSCMMKRPAGHDVTLLTDFQREFHVYTVLLPEFERMYARRGKWLQFSAKLLHLHDDAVPDNALFTEDVFKQSFFYVQRHLGLDMEQTECALEKLAQFHAASACYYQLHGPYSELYISNKYEGECFAKTRTQYMEMLLKCLPLYKNGQHLMDKLKTCGDNLRYPYDSRTPGNRHGFQVLNHGCSNRILLKSTQPYSHANIRLEGFVMAQYACPTLDLLSFLLLSTALENKLQHFDHFVSFYHDKLAENLKLLRYTAGVPTLKELHKAIIDKGEWAFFISISVLPFFFDPIISTSMLDVTIDIGTDEELKYFRSTTYIEHINQLLPWMIDRGFLDFKSE